MGWGHWRGTSESLGWEMLGLMLGQGWADKNDGQKGGIKRGKKAK